MRHRGAGGWCSLGFRGPHILLPGCRRKPRSSWLTFSGLPLLVWQLVLPTNKVCLTGEPANPATICSFLLKVPVGDPAYLQGPDTLGASLRNIPIQAFGWAGSLHCLPPVGLWSNAFENLCWAFHPRAPPPQGREMSHASQSMPAQGPLMPIQRPTPAVAAAAAVGASTWNVMYFLAQPINVQVQHASGL